MQSAPGMTRKRLEEIKNMSDDPRALPIPPCINQAMKELIEYADSNLPLADEVCVSGG